MRGTLQGDFSRGPAAPDGSDRALHMQQGRVLLDADWNAQMALLRSRLETGAADLVGASGGPAGADGFRLEVKPLVALGGRGFAVAGGSGGFVLPAGDVAASGVTFEARLAFAGDGTVAELRPLGGGPAWTLSVVGGRLRFHCPGAGGGTVESSEVHLDDRLHHLAVVVGATETTIFVDGSPKARETFGLVPPTGAQVLLLGAAWEAGEPRHLLRASIAGVRLWHAALDDHEVAALADRRRIDDRATALVGDWRFDDGHGRTVVDHGTCCNHAELRGDVGWVPHAPSIGAGRYYVDGIACTLATQVLYARQPDLPGAVFPRPGAAPSCHLFYLDVWERTVSAAEDPQLREIALGGADTTVRSRQVVQVRSLEVPLDEAAAGAASAAWQAFLAADRRRGRLRARRHDAGLLRDLDNCLYRIEVHESGFPYIWPRPPGAAAEATGLQPVAGGISAAGRRYRCTEGPGLRVGRTVEVWSAATDAEDAAGPLATVTEVDAEAGIVVLAGELEAVAEEEAVRARPVATFKWSRTNGSVAFAVAAVDAGGTEVTVAPSSRSLLELPDQGWLEAVDQASVLAGRRSPLVRIQKIDPAARQLTVDTPLPGGAFRQPAPGAILRLWDHGQGAETALSTGVLPAGSHDRWQRLEMGIEVSFGDRDRLVAGDYWWLVARTDAEDLEWPLDDQGGPDWREPDGVLHRYAPLAMLVYDASGFRLHDLRRVFAPLTHGGGGPGGRVDGTLNVAGDLTVDGNATVAGRVQGEELLGTVCGVGAVGSRALADRAVTRRALAPEVGTVPDRFALLGPDRHATRGYSYTGMVLRVDAEEVVWLDLCEVGDGPPGPMRSIAFGDTVYSFLDSGEVWAFDGADFAWSQRQRQPVARNGFAVARLDDRIYLVGGADAAGKPVDDVQAYEPATDHWHHCRPLPHGSARAAAAPAAGWIHVMGGERRAFAGPRVTRRHHAYDPMTDAWHKRRPLPSARAAAAAAFAGGAISVVGGACRWLLGRFGRVLIDEHLRYLPAGDRWLAPAAALGIAQAEVRLVSVFDQLWAVGGRAAGGWTSACARWDPGRAAWIESTPLHEVIEAPGVSALSGTLVVIGAMRAGGRGTLVEAARVARRFYVHERVRRRHEGDFTASFDAEAEPAGAQGASPTIGDPSSAWIDGSPDDAPPAGSAGVDPSDASGTDAASAVAPEAAGASASDHPHPD